MSEVSLDHPYLTLKFGEVEANRRRNFESRIGVYWDERGRVR